MCLQGDDALLAFRSRVQANLQDREKELEATMQKLAEVAAQEAKSSKSAQAGAVRVEHLLMELQQVRLAVYAQAVTCVP